MSGIKPMVTKTTADLTVGWLIKALSQFDKATPLGVFDHSVYRKRELTPQDVGVVRAVYGEDGEAAMVFVSRGAEAHDFCNRIERRGRPSKGNFHNRKAENRKTKEKHSK